MKELLELLARKIKELKERSTQSQRGLGQIDTLEVPNCVAAALRDQEWSLKELEELEKKLTSYEDQLKDHDENVVSSGIAAAVEKGELVKKEEVDAQLLAAKKEGKDEIESQIKAAKEKAELAEGRRSEVKEAHGEHVAASMSVDALGADNYLSQAKLIASRVDELKESGITPDHAEVFNRYLAMGEEEYRQCLAGIKASLAGLNVKPTKSPGDGTPKPVGLAASKPGSVVETAGKTQDSDSDESPHLVL